MMSNNKVFKRKYEKKLVCRAVGIKENREFLLEHFKKEWEKIEKTIESDRRRQKLYEVAKETGAVLGFTILGLAVVCGVLLVGTVAPNVISAFGRFGRHRRYFDKKSFRKKVAYFERRGYIDVAEKNKSNLIEMRLTKFGKEQVVKRALGDLKIIPQETWDGIWRLVVFDIPERNKWAREGIRTHLKRMGFYPLQKSTFVFPYSCQEEIDFLGRLYDVIGHLRFIETSTISFDDDLKEFFNPKFR